MKNINDEAPQFEPARQSVTVKEGAQAGLQLMYIQAYDPDGDKIVFSYSNPSNFIKFYLTVFLNAAV